MHNVHLTRRGFVLTAATGIGGILLSACAGLTPPQPGSSTAAGSATIKPSTSSKLQLPTFTPQKTAPAPDVKGTDLVPDGYVTYPKNPFQSVASPPGDGSDVTVVGEQLFQALVPVDQNTLWQGLNKALNVNLKLTLVPFADWYVRLPTLIAGGDLPDILYVLLGVLPDLPSFLETKIQDLTAFVSGDNIKDYPNLPALPTVSWKGTVYDGKIFAVPGVFPRFYWGLWGHQNFLESAGLDWPKSGAEFRTALKTLTHPDQMKWGIASGVGSHLAYDLITSNTSGSLWP